MSETAGTENSENQVNKVELGNPGQTTEQAEAPKSYEDAMVDDKTGVDRLAQGHGDAPADVAGVTGGLAVDPDGNPAFHGADQANLGLEQDMPEHTAFEEGAAGDGRAAQ